MKVISYDPREVKNVPKFFNDNIEMNKAEDYIMFIFNDMFEHVVNMNNLQSDYINLMNLYDLPFMFYSYYIHFNKVLTDSISKPNPRARFFITKDFGFDIVNQPSYGMLILNLKKLNGFKFNEDYKLAFYIQDLIHYCYENKLWISETYFIDTFMSWNHFNDNFKNGYVINSKDFSEEKALFQKNKKTVSEPINDFLNKIKEISLEKKQKMINNKENA